MTDKAKKITAKFETRCPVCSYYTAIGEAVYWEKGEKATHADCHEKVIGEIRLQDARGTAAEAARGVGAMDFDPDDYDDPNHPENAEAVLAMEECGQGEALSDWHAWHAEKRVAAQPKGVPWGYPRKGYSGARR